jgi:hypothetical protein
LLTYGFLKVFPLQFPAPDFARLSETFGEASPMGLLWTFMGASPGYERFAGCAEVLPGLLLLFRRTSTAGAVIAIATMGNVVALNFCYDVPAKLLSSHLLLMALFLLIPDIAPLWRFLILRGISKLEGVWVPPFERRPLRIAAIVLQILVGGSIVYETISDNYGRYKALQTTAEQIAPLTGVWNSDATADAPFDRRAAASENVWRRLAISRVGRAGVRDQDGKLLRFVLTQEVKKRQLHMTGWRNDHSIDVLYQLPDKDHLILTGTIDRAQVELRFHRFNPSQFLLTTRGFHWISEDPYNL